MEFKIHDITPLSEIREKMTKGLELRMDLNHVNETTIQELENIANEHEGNCTLKLNVTTVHENRVIDLEMLSRKVKIDPDDTLIKRLDEFEELSYNVIL